MGWKSYGISVQLVPVGANWIWPNPLAAEAVIVPRTPVVRSSSMVCKPLAVSFIVTEMWSPGFMNITSGLLLGFPDVAGLKSSGFGGPIGLPDFVRNAKLTYSVPPRISFRQVEFKSVPLIGSSERLSMVSAAHQSTGSQLWLLNCSTHPGG